MKSYRVCIRCGHKVVRETDKNIDYPFYCPHCDENMYRFETINVKKIKGAKNGKNL